MKVNFHLDKQRKPNVNDGMTVSYGLAKRGGYKIRWFLILALILSPLIVAGYYFYRSNILIIAPAVLTSNPVVMTAQDEAYIVEVSVEPGDSVGKNQTILTAANRVLDAEIRFINSQLSELKEPSSTVEPRYLAAINEAKSNLAKVTEIQQRYEKFREQGRISELDYAGITGMVNAQNKQLNDLYIELDEARRLIAQRHQAGPVKQQSRALQKELVGLEARRDELAVTAPFDGRVLEVHLVDGQRIKPGDELVTLADNEMPRIVAFLEPKYLRLAKPGSKVNVVFPDNSEFKATISKDVELVSKLPTQLASPFKGQPAYLKVLIDLDSQLAKKYWIEGLTLDVYFDRTLASWVNK